MVGGNLPDIVLIQRVGGPLTRHIQYGFEDMNERSRTFLMSGVTNEKDIHPQILA